MIDLPRRLTGYAEQKGDVVLAADWQQYGWLDLDRPRTAADVASVPDLGAAESGRREAAVPEMIGSRINRAMLVAARAVDRGFDPERFYPPNCPKRPRH